MDLKMRSVPVKRPWLHPSIPASQHPSLILGVDDDSSMLAEVKRALAAAVMRPSTPSTRPWPFARFSLTPLRDGGTDSCILFCSILSFQVSSYIQLQLQSTYKIQRQKEKKRPVLSHDLSAATVSTASS